MWHQWHNIHRQQILLANTTYTNTTEGQGVRVYTVNITENWHLQKVWVSFLLMPNTGALMCFNFRYYSTFFLLKANREPSVHRLRCLHRSQLLWHGLAEALVRSQSPCLLLLRQRERSVCKITPRLVSQWFSAQWRQWFFSFINILWADKQQKGEFAIDGYTVKMNNTLRKDSKKDCCFEISAPDKRVYQVGLSPSASLSPLSFLF